MKTKTMSADNAAARLSKLESKIRKAEAKVAKAEAKLELKRERLAEAKAAYEAALAVETAADEGESERSADDAD